MNIIEISGTVIGGETWSQTHVSGKSTGIRVGGIGASSGRTTSTVTNVAQVWVQAADGREVAVRTNPDRFATRDGHRVSMALLVRNSGPGFMVAGYNHSTGEKRREGVGNMYFSTIAGLLFTFWIPLMFFGLGVVVGLIACALYLWGIGYMFTSVMRLDAAGRAFMGKLDAAPRPAATAPAVEAA